MLEIYIIISIAAAVLTVITGLSPWLLIPLFIGFFVVIVILHFAFVAVMSKIIDRKTETDPRELPPFIWFVLTQSCRIACFCCGLFVKFKGMDKLEKGQKYLFVGNHVSNFDPIAAMYMLRKFNTLFISKPENFDIPVAGAYMRRSGFMAIDRDNPRNALRTIMTAADVLMTTDRSVCIYPEGTRNKTGEKLLEFHNGVFKIAQRAKVPVVIIATEGIRYNTRLPHRAVIEVIAVIDTEKVCAMKTNELGEDVRQKLLAVL